MNKASILSYPLAFSPRSRTKSKKCRSCIEKRGSGSWSRCQSYLGLCQPDLQIKPRKR